MGNLNVRQGYLNDGRFIREKRIEDGTGRSFNETTIKDRMGRIWDNQCIDTGNGYSLNKQTYKDQYGHIFGRKFIQENDDCSGFNSGYNRGFDNYDRYDRYENNYDGFNPSTNNNGYYANRTDAEKVGDSISSIAEGIEAARKLFNR